jgi:hypothetical protein
VNHVIVNIKICVFYPLNNPIKCFIWRSHNCVSALTLQNTTVDNLMRAVCDKTFTSHCLRAFHWITRLFFNLFLRKLFALIRIYSALNLTRVIKQVINCAALNRQASFALSANNCSHICLSRYKVAPSDVFGRTADISLVCHLWVLLSSAGKCWLRGFCRH